MRTNPKPFKILRWNFLTLKQYEFSTRWHTPDRSSTSRSGAGMYSRSWTSRSRVVFPMSRSRDRNDSVSSRSWAFYVSRRSVSRDAPMFNIKIVESWIQVNSSTYSPWDCYYCQLVSNCNLVKFESSAAHRLVSLLNAVLTRELRDIL